MTGLRLALMGQLDIRKDGAPLADFESRKAQALLCYLAVTGQPHDRLFLAGLLWPEMPEASALSNLRKTVAVLHHSVDEHVHIRRRSLAFNFKAPHRLDVREFERAMIRSRVLTPDTVTVMKEALDLYRDEFLAEFYVHDALPFEEWVLAQRARLREMVLDGLHRLAVYYYQRGALDDALAYNQRLLALEPWREEAHRQQMFLLAQMGQRSEALIEYEKCRQVLAKELGIAPSVETEALAKAVREQLLGVGGGGTRGGEPASGQHSLALSPLNPFATGPPHNLPPERTPFVGREVEIGDIVRRLRGRACRLLTLAGPGGIGKTRLAVQAAHRFIDNTAPAALFADGVFFVALDEVSSVESLAPAIANVLNVPYRGPLEAKTQLRRFLEGKNLLLLLDNFEHLLFDGHLPDGAGLISEILAAAPGVKVLVTSSDALHVQEEWFYPVRGMAFPSGASGWSEETTPEDYSAVQLFVQCAGRARPGFSLQEEAKYVVRICQLLEGMPLGIELAAGWLRSLPCRIIAQELEQGLDLLTSAWQNLPPRHRSVRAAFDRSWQLLSATERDVLKRLSALRDEFEAEEAARVAGASRLQLAGLIEKSLLQYSPPDHYRMHELLRRFCTERLKETAEDKAETTEKRSHVAPDYPGQVSTTFSQEQQLPPALSV